jgi:hypothetical protein
MKQVKAIKSSIPSFSADLGDDLSAVSHSNQDLKSLKIWARVVIEAPLSELIT